MCFHFQKNCGHTVFRTALPCLALVRPAFGSLPEDLTELDLEELMAIRVTTVSRKADWTWIFQHRLRMGRLETVWGAGYRRTWDWFEGSATMDFDPARSTAHLFSGFLHQEWTLAPERLVFTAGSKFEHNTYTGFEVQPNVRLGWRPSPGMRVSLAGQNLFDSPRTEFVSSASRTLPARVERGVYGAVSWTF